MSELKIPIRIENAYLSKFSFDFNNYKNILWINSFRESNLDRTIEIIRENNNFDKIILISYRNYDFIESEKSQSEINCKYVNSDGYTTDEFKDKKKSDIRFRQIKLEVEYDSDVSNSEKYTNFHSQINEELKDNLDRKIFIIDNNKFERYQKNEIFSNLINTLLEKQCKFVFNIEDINLLDMIFYESFNLFDIIVSEIANDYWSIFINVIKKNFDKYLTEEYLYLKSKEHFQDIASNIIKEDKFIVFSKIDKKLLYADKNYFIRTKKINISNTSDKSSNIFIKHSDISSNTHIRKLNKLKLNNFMKNDTDSLSDKITNSSDILPKISKNNNKNNNKKNININSVKDNDIVLNINL